MKISVGNEQLQKAIKGRKIPLVNLRPNQKIQGPGKKNTNYTFNSITVISKEHSQFFFSSKKGKYFNTVYLWPLREVHNEKKTSSGFFFTEDSTFYPLLQGILPYFPISVIINL